MNSPSLRRARPTAIREVDTIVIGAGTAGLAAAAALAASGQSVTLVEARERVGGRIFSLPAAGRPGPLELGAEFIHGESPHTMAWLAKTGSAALDAAQERWRKEAGKLKAGDELFEAMKRGLARVRKPASDLPFSRFLEGPAKGVLSPRARKFARMLVEGFDAADATRASTIQILEEWSGGSAADAPTFRPLAGYGTLLHSLQAALDPAKVRLQLHSAVRLVRWQRGSVSVEGLRQGTPFRLQAPRAIITLPLGVLQLPAGAAAGVDFEPPLSTKQAALAGLASGPVLKVLLDFREAFWERLDRKRYRDAAFFHAPGMPFPVFWTTLPLRSPLLTAWAAGPNAGRLAGAGRAEILQAALTSLDTLFGKRGHARRNLEAAHFHDWQADPFARGAYSYVTVGGSSARRNLARPLQDTLFFAGEAADTSGAAATVEGALRSGERAAMQILKGRKSPQAPVTAR